MSTITIPKLLANFETTLAATMSAAATTLTLDRSTDGDAVTLSGTYELTFDEGTSSEEHMYVTLAGASGTVTRRGLSRVDGWTEVTANKLQHNRGASVKITNFSLVLLSRLLNGDDTFNSVDWTGVESISGLATPTSGETTKAANVAYANALAIAGAPDATTAVKGIVKMSTAPVSPTAPIAVGDNDSRVPTAGQTALLAGITADAAEINKLDGLTTTEAELQQLQGISANVSSTNLNTLNAGTTSAADELHYHDLYRQVKSQLNAGYTVFQGRFGDGLTVAATGGGAVTRLVSTTALTVSGAGADAVLTMANGLQHDVQGTIGDYLAWSDNPRVKIIIAGAFGATTTQDFFLGIHEGALAAAQSNATLTANHVGFLVDDGTLYISIANGVTQEKTDISSGITLTNNNIFEIDYTGGTDAKFYVNGTLKGTLSAQLPTGAGIPFFNIAITATANDRIFFFKHPFAIEFLTNA